MGLNKHRGISSVTALIVILVVASTLTVSLGYWSGVFFTPPQNSEYLELSNATIWDLGGSKAIKFVVKNTGTKDVRIEYVVFNGDILPYASKMFGEWIPYNFIEGEHLIVPYNSQVETYIPFETNEESLEIRLHTLAGNDFTKVLLASSLPTEYEEPPYTRFEQIEIHSAVCTYDATDTQWIVTLRLKNIGTAPATLIGCYINEVEVNGYSYSNPTPNGEAETDMTASKTLDSGASATIRVYINQNWGSVTAGTTVNIKIHSAGGMDYVKLIGLVEDSPPTDFEQIEIQSAVCYKDVSDPANYFWNITMTLKNTGTRDATLISAFINEVEVNAYGITSYAGTESNWATSMATTTYLTSGASTVICFYIDPDKAGASLTSGTTIYVRIHSSGGMDYLKLVELT
jgi:hypothetical protein